MAASQFAQLPPTPGTAGPVSRPDSEFRRVEPTQPLASRVTPAEPISAQDQPAAATPAAEPAKRDVAVEAPPTADEAQKAIVKLVAPNSPVSQPAPEETALGPTMAKVGDQPAEKNPAVEALQETAAPVPTSEPAQEKVAAAPAVEPAQEKVAAAPAVEPPKETVASAEPAVEPSKEKAASSEPRTPNATTTVPPVAAKAAEQPAAERPAVAATPAEQRVIPLPDTNHLAIISHPEPEGMASGQATAPAAVTAPSEPGVGVAPRPAYPDTGLPAVATTVGSDRKPAAGGPLLVPDTGVPAVGAAVEAQRKPTEPPVTESGNPAAERPAQKAIPAWQEPVALLAHLDALSGHEASRRWATEAKGLVRRLGPALAADRGQADSILDRLERLPAEGLHVALRVPERAVARDLARTSYALERRVGVWKQIRETGGGAAVQDPPPNGQPDSMSLCLAEVESLTSHSPEGAAWRSFLLVDALRQWAARRPAGQQRLPPELAEKFLGHIALAPMTPGQRQFLASPPLAALRVEVLRRTAEPIDAAVLLGHLERYEQTGLASDGRRLAQDCEYLTVGSDRAGAQLAHRVETYYRNANVRLAVNAELLNRMIPKRQPEYSRVRDTVVGVPVRGTSLAANDVAVRLLPDPQRVRLALEVSGEVAAVTQSTSGPATFFSDSESTYTARKPLDVDLREIRAGPTEVEVDNNMQLRRIRTDFDPLPLVGPLVRAVARSQHDQRRPAADAEVRQKIAAKAQQRIDNEVDTQVAEGWRNVQENLLGPLDALLLEPTLLDAETTPQRLAMRIRLAGRDQLGSHTPRPQAPASSLASVQIHESALNNVIERLGLDGQTFSPPELGERIAQRLRRPPPAAAEAEQEDVKITFADHDAIHLRCVGGRLEVTLAIAKLTKSPRKWSNFQVRAFYRPEVRGRSVDLVRDGVVQLIGTRLTTGSQIALRGVFSKVFSQKRPWHVSPEHFVNNPKLQGLAVTQFAIDDGWIGAAIGPQPASTLRSVLLRR
ncbi:MAG: hypothetical protein ABSF26_28355 [Thermoguttaceae bacterium]